MTEADATTLVIFGASGDLTHRKLIPALCSLHRKGRLPHGLRIVGVSRSPKTDAEFRDSLLQAAGQTLDMRPSPEQWQAFASRIFYVEGDVASGSGLAPLQARLGQLEAPAGGKGNRLYYLALAPSLYEPAVNNLGKSGMAGQQTDSGWRRAVVEKPFGVDLASAKRLNESIQAVFSEHQVYRIDHYLGKETVQNILVFRFANTIFEPIWNRNYIDHVQITVAETVSVSERGDFYDHAGLIRDMIQNHMLQLLSLIAMEPPSSVDADSLRDEKVKVLKAIRRIEPQEAPSHGVAGQYDGYCNEPGVAAGSRTPSYAALRLYIDNWRWQNVPFYLRSGKALAEKTTEIVIQFRRPPHLMFSLDRDADGQEIDLPANTLAICVQPGEGFHIQFQAKTPDSGLQLQPVDLEFHYQTAFGGPAVPDAYERLLLDALTGDASLFTRNDEIEQAWMIIDPFISGFAADQSPPPAEYTPGSWGPSEAEEFIQRDGRDWLRGCGEH